MPTANKKEPGKTHVELEVICPLAHEAVARRAGVAAVVLEDVVAPRRVPVLVEHHWSASTAWGKETRQNPTNQHQTFTKSLLFGHG